MRQVCRLGACTVLAVTVLGCGSSGTSENMEMTSAVVGTSGGMLASSDGTLQVVIPPGALSNDVMVTIAPTPSPGAGSLGKVYEIGPTGTQFATPVTLTLDYSAVSLAGTDPSMLRVATFAAGSWQILSGASVDMQGRTVSGTTTHLSPYGITTAASGAMCATVAGGMSCGGFTGGVDASAPAGSSGPAPNGGVAAAFISDSAGGSVAASDGGASAPNGGAPSSCVPTTCAEATNACAGYPGATMTGCTDGPNGYMATCCFPSGGSICLAAAAGGGGCTQDCGVGGSCTTTCPPAPTCATATTATACGSLSGATLQDCTDTGSGYTAACCFAPRAPACTTVSSGRSCGAAPNGATNCPAAPTCADANPCAGITGASMQSCTDSADGYTAVCCLPVGVVPSNGGSSSGPAGSADGGAPSGGTAGTTGSGPGTTGGGGGTTGGSQTGTGGPAAGSGGTTGGGTTGGGGVIDPGTGSAGNGSGGVSGGAPTGAGATGGPPICKSSADCPAGEACVAGFCEPSGSPTGGGGVSGGTSGTAGVGGMSTTGAGGTSEPPPVCKADADCPTGSLCVAGFCEVTDGTTGVGGVGGASSGGAGSTGAGGSAQ